jgi:hypothetical protein
METMNRTKILMGRMNKLENFQSKILNLMQCRVSDGVIPVDIRQQIKTNEVQDKLKAKIDKAERIKLQIAIAIYNDI